MAPALSDTDGVACWATPTGPAVNNVSHEHWSIGAALSSTTGLFIYSDATNANLPTAILVERIA